MPYGSYDESTTGVALVPLGGSGVSAGFIATPNPVNSCTGLAVGTLVSTSRNPEAICTSNGTDVYLIDGTTIVNTLTSGGTGTVGFTGGSCTTCGVVSDSAAKTAILSIATGSGTSGYQLLNISSQTLSAPIPASPDQIGESFGLLPISKQQFLILSPTEYTSGAPTDYQIIDVTHPGSSTPASGSIAFSYANAGTLFPETELDSGAADSTGIVLATDEFTGNIFIADLLQASATTSPNTWTAAAQLQNLPEFASFSAGTTGIAVAYGAHVALLEDEFGSTLFGAIKLPSSAGSGTPAVQDWVIANMPNDPSGAGWYMPLDPHGLTAAFTVGSLSSDHVEPGGTPRGIGVLMNDQRTFVALIDLNQLLSAPRTTPSPSHTIDPTYDLVAHNVVAFVPIPAHP